MTNPTSQPSKSPRDILIKTLLFSAKHFPTGVLIFGDNKSAKLHPRNPASVSKEAISEINEILRDFRLRDLVEAAISINPNGAPNGRSINDKIPLKLTEVSPDADFRLQWNPAGPLYVLDPDGPYHGDQLLIRFIYNH